MTGHYVSPEVALRAKVIAFLTETLGFDPLPTQIDSVMAVLTGAPDLLWEGLTIQELVSIDRWDGFDGRKFARRYERRLLQW